MSFPGLGRYAARLQAGFAILGLEFSRQLRARRGKSVRVTGEPAGFADSWQANCEKQLLLPHGWKPTTISPIAFAAVQKFDAIFARSTAPRRRRAWPPAARISRRW
jgi:hypothetical protein